MDSIFFQKLFLFSLSIPDHEGHKFKCSAVSPKVTISPKPYIIVLTLFGSAKVYHCLTSHDNIQQIKAKSQVHFFLFGGRRGWASLFSIQNRGKKMYFSACRRTGGGP